MVVIPLYAKSSTAAKSRGSSLRVLATQKKQKKSIKSCHTPKIRKGVSMRLMPRQKLLVLEVYLICHSISAGGQQTCCVGRAEQAAGVVNKVSQHDQGDHVETGGPRRREAAAAQRKRDVSLLLKDYVTCEREGRTALDDGYDESARDLSLLYDGAVTRVPVCETCYGFVH